MDEERTQGAASGVGNTNRTVTKGSEMKDSKKGSTAIKASAKQIMDRDTSDTAVKPTESSGAKQKQRTGREAVRDGTKRPQDNTEELPEMPVSRKRASIKVLLGPRTKRS